MCGSFVGMKMLLHSQYNIHTHRQRFFFQHKNELTWNERGKKINAIYVNQAFFCAFSKNSRGKTQDLFQNSRLKTQGLFQKLNVPEVFQWLFQKKKPFCGKFCMQNSKVMLKTATFGCKKHFCGKKINIYHLILPFSSKNLSIFPETQQFFKLKAKTQGKSKTQG